MTSYFNNISKDYLSAEITALFLHDKTKDKYYNLLTLIELVPSEQPASPLLGEKTNKYLDRQKVNNVYTVFTVRALDFKVEAAIGLFENAQHGYQLSYNETLEVAIEMFPGTILEREPSGEFPLLIDKSRDKTISMLLPYRDTGFRVWTKLDRGKHFLHNIEQKVREKILKKSADLTLKHLGFDIQSLQEHLGNVYLFCCNPVIRKYDLSLLDFDTDLLARFYVRKNQSLDGCKITFWDKRAGNLSFNLEHPIVDRLTRLKLPVFPQLLITTIFDRNGYPLENHSAGWANFELNMGVQESVVNLFDDKSGAVTSVAKVSSAGISRMGTYDHSLANYLKDSHKKRRVALAKANKEFAFFPGGASDKEEARDYIADLVNKSSQSCVLLDPYFSAQALYYAFVISKLSVPIQIIGAAFYLRKKIDRDDPDSQTYGQALLEQLQSYRQQVPLQSIECRVLLGKKSQLHDRYIVSDENVYLLGSSFHEFGARATSIFKVPAPDEMIAKATEWWSEEKHTMLLEDFIQKHDLIDDESEDH